ncbi:MAG: 23S rRNA (adenine(2503)-C(2))-methyltransferase RlmN [Planctomycetes bacterium]|nr:23S rRNA (adenine(2503)-C(2))-methyltransferase RlmN [Planctomycetota bacterium]
MDVLGLTSGEFVERLQGRRARREALQTYAAVFRRDESDTEFASAQLPEFGTTQVDGETVKFTLKVGGGLETESVIIPMPHTGGGFSRTLCVSSQVGCAMGCRFCETAQMGLLRNLSSAEIVAQWFAARHRVENAIDGGRGFQVKNIVFMGMGEPTENLDAVLHSVRILTDHYGPSIAPSNITISTVGRAEGIRRIADFARQTGFHRLHLALSLNAPNDEIRSQIMPINKSEPIAAILDAVRGYPDTAGPICVEYVLIPGVNDAPEHCDAVCALLKDIRCSLNLIPYNPRRNSPWPAPDEESVRAFMARAIANKQFCKRRGTKGRSAMAACGQLGSEAIRTRKFVALQTGSAGSN